MSNAQDREQERAGTLLLGQVKPAWPVLGVSGRLRAAAHSSPWSNNLHLPHLGSAWLGDTGLLEAELLLLKDQTLTDFDLVQFPSGDTSVASEGMANTKAPAPLCSKVIQVLEFRGNCNCCQHRKKSNILGPYVGWVTQTAAQWIGGEVWEGGCGVIPFSSHYIYWDIKLISLSWNITICTSNSFNSLAIHPELWHLSHPFISVETLVFPASDPHQGLLPLPGAWRLCRHRWLSSSHGSSSLGTQGWWGVQGSTGQGGCRAVGIWGVWSLRGLLVVMEGGNSPGTEPVPQSTWEPVVIYNSKVDSSRKRNHSGKA